jgi:hypothetical protein
MEELMRLNVETTSAREKSDAGMDPGTASARAAADAGIGVPFEEFRAWVDSLGSANPLPKPQARRQTP